MRGPGYPDCLTVLNGPEDGTEFPIVRAPFNIGRDPACSVNVRLDVDVRPFHVLVSVVSDGYRLRRLEGGPVYVNGKRTGLVRSRLLRSGGVVQVGSTMLTLECAPDGLARRSRGLVFESDLAWLLRAVWKRVWRLTRGVFRLVATIVGRVLGSPLGITAALVLAYLFVPPFQRAVNGVAYMAYQKLILGVLRQFLSS